MIRHIIDNVKFVVFFGTPHRDTDAANVAAPLDILVRALQLKGSRQYIEELSTKSDRIEDINKEFKHHLKHLSVHSFYEECPTSLIGDVVCETLHIIQELRESYSPAWLASIYRLLFPVRVPS